MFRASQLVSMAVVIASFARTASTAQDPAGAARRLVTALRDDLRRYTPQHPKVEESETLIRILETQTELLRQPKSERDTALVEDQIKTLNEQIEGIRRSMASYTLKHPNLERSQALIDALAEQVESLRQ